MAQKSDYILGLDIGGTKLAAGLVSQEGELLHALRTPTPRGVPPPQALDELASLALKVLAESGDEGKRVQQAGLSIAGPLDMVRGIVYHLPNLPGWDYFPVRDYLSEKIGLPVFMENDANAAAVGEYHFGKHHHSSRFIYLTISTGIGSGFVIDGKLYRGARFGGTEFGHMNIKPDGYLCGCGAKGCFEAHCSGTAIARRAGRRYAKEKGLHPGEVKMDALEFFAAVDRRESWATTLVRDLAQDFGRALANLVNALGPDLIVLGGGVANQWHHFDEVAMFTLRSQAFPEFVEACTIEKSQNADHIALIGAAVVADQNRG